MFQRLHEGLNVAMITQISEWLQWGLLNGAKITLRSSLCYNYIKDWMLLWLHRSLNVAMIKQMFECPYDYTEGQHVVATN